MPAEFLLPGMDYLQGFKKEFKKFRVSRSFKENIEPEEILIDAQKEKDFSEQKIEIPLHSKIFVIFFGLILFALAALALRAGYFQISKNENYLALAERNSLRIYPIAASRGLIYDRNLAPLVSNQPGYNIFLSPQDLPQNKNERDTLVEQISELLQISPKDLTKALEEFNFEKIQRMVLVSDLAPDKILGLEAMLKNFPGLSVEKGITRQYSYGEILSHVLGYTGAVSEAELKKFSDYLMSDHIGKDGLEAIYEGFLKGKTGERRVEVDAKSRQIKEAGIKEPVGGQDIVTTIDLELQKKLFNEISRMLGNLKISKAAAVAMDPRNGQVLALVSQPSFDNNLFEKNTPVADFEKIQDDSNAPLLNRVISGLYPPGSTIKPLIASAALEEKVILPFDTIYDPGQITIVNQYDPNIIYTFLDWKAHGAVNLYSAISESCNVYFYTVGGGYGNIDGLGVERIKKYLALFGLGQSTNIDLPGEASGLIPDADWKEKEKNEKWFIGDTYHVSIGQGDLLVTPLQIASAISAIANGGKLFSPYLVDKIVDSDKNSIKAFKPRVLRQDFILNKNLEAVRKGMRQAVTAGSARFLNDLPVKVAGKTGTAQVAGQQRENAWFVGFAPYDDPQIVLVILLENAGEGSSYAVPIAKEVFRWYFTK